MKEVVIQSFYPYALEVFVKGGKVILPASSAKPKNIVVLDQDVADELAKDETFASMVEQKIYRYLDKIPTSYYDSMEQIGRANAQYAEAKAEADRFKNEAENAKKAAAKLQSQIDDMGGVTGSIDAKVLEAQAEVEKHKAEAEAANAEIAELKRQLAVKRGRPAKEE